MVHNTLNVKYENGEAKEVKYLEESESVVYTKGSALNGESVGSTVFSLRSVNGRFSADELSRVQRLVRDLPFVDEVTD